MFEQHYRPSSEASTTTHPTAQPPQLSSMMAEFGYDDDNVVDLDVSLDPFEEYRERGCVPRARLQPYSSPIEYWIDQKKTKPSWSGLAEMAIDFLTVPPTSCDIERAFSAGRHTINDFQHSTSHELLDAKVTVGSWAAQKSPFFGSVDATIKKATKVMQAEMRGSKTTVPSKRTVIDLLTDGEEEEV